MSAPPPLNEEHKPPAKPRLRLTQVVEALAEIDIGEFLIDIGTGVKAFQQARKKSKEKTDDKQDRGN